MQTLRHLLARWTGFIWALLKPLGAWGVFAIGAIDGGLLGMPLDPVVAGYIYAKPHLFWLYSLMASAGSTLGSLVIYAIGYKMGELVLEKRLGTSRFQSIRDKFDRHEFLALMVPAMMPPGFPFKAFALSAAVFEMHVSRFMLAIFAGRMARFLILSVLVIKFGPTAVTLAGDLARRHARLLLIAFGLAIVFGVGFWWWAKQKKMSRE